MSLQHLFSFFWPDPQVFFFLMMHQLRFYQLNIYMYVCVFIYVYINICEKKSVTIANSQQPKLQCYPEEHKSMNRLSKKSRYYSKYRFKMISHVPEVLQSFSQSSISSYVVKQDGLVGAISNNYSLESKGHSFFFLFDS